MISKLQRSLKLSYQSTGSYFAHDLFLIHKLVFLYTESISNIKNNENRLILAPVNLDREVFNESLGLVSSFRKLAIDTDPVIFDMSNNAFSEMYMLKSINMLKICS